MGMRGGIYPNAASPLGECGTSSMGMRDRIYPDAASPPGKWGPGGKSAVKTSGIQRFTVMIYKRT